MNKYDLFLDSVIKLQDYRARFQSFLKINSKLYTTLL